MFSQYAHTLFWKVEIMTQNQIIICFIIILQLMAVIICIIFYTKYRQLKFSNETLKRKDIVTSARYCSINAQYLNSIKYIHSSRDKLITIRNQMKRHDYEGLENNLNSLNNDILKAMNILHTDSNVLDSVINNYINELNELNISLKPVIEYDDFDFMTNLNQSKLFNELFNIVINYFRNSCIEKKKKNIILKSKKISNTIIVQLIIDKYEIDDGPEQDLSYCIKSLDNKYNLKSNVLINKLCISIMLIMQN